MRGVFQRFRAFLEILMTFICLFKTDGGKIIETSEFPFEAPEARIQGGA